MTLKIKGQKFGDWQPRKSLGEGGNCVVWLASNSSGEEAAIKLLTKLDDKSALKMYARFKAEVEVVQANSDIEGLLPIIDCYLPDKISGEIPWYVMPIAQSLDKYINDRNFETAIQVVLETGKILVKLHERKISHRDIKPANILIRDDKVFLSDFGLVDFPDKQDLTSTGERIGARWTIAPEMERDSQNADGKAADVYSLAKTLWILLSSRKNGFEGQYNPSSVNSLSRLQLTELEERNFGFIKAPPLYTKPLDDLLKASTDDDPLQRPRMSQFVEELRAWTEIYRDFQRRNSLQWQDVQATLFPMVLPQRVIWEQIDGIAEILNYLGSIDSLNHMHLPNRGGMDLLGATLGAEPGTIELNVGDRTVYVVKPNRLIFENLDFDWEWNYFRLETGGLNPKRRVRIRHNCQYLVEIAPKKYISRERWEQATEQGQEYSSEYRLISRYMKGDFLILQKTSLYNSSGYTYDGKHNQMGTDEFRQYINLKVKLVQQLRQDEQVIKFASDKDITLDELIRNHLDKVYRQEFLERKKNKDLA